MPTTIVRPEQHFKNYRIYHYQAPPVSLFPDLQYHIITCGYDPIRHSPYLCSYLHMHMFKKLGKKKITLAFMDEIYEFD